MTAFDRQVTPGEFFPWTLLSGLQAASPGLVFNRQPPPLRCCSTLQTCQDAGERLRGAESGPG